MTLQWRHWPYSIILSPCLFCLFVLNSPGSLMETDTTPPRKGMTFTTPLCSCKWRDYLAVPPSAVLGTSGILSLVPSESAPRLVVSAAREPQTLTAGSWLRVSRTALSILFLFQRVAGKFLKTCSLFMSLMLGSWPLLISGLAAALFNIRSNFPPPPPSAWGRMNTIVFSACQGSKRGCHGAECMLGKWRGGICFSNGTQRAALGSRN